MTQIYQPEKIDRIQIPSKQQQRVRQKARAKRNKNNGIILFTVFICLSCFYLETQIFQPILADRKAYYMSLLTYFDVFMCLWCYLQTIRIGNKVLKLREIPTAEFQNEKFFDFAYSSIRKTCDFCDFYKFPRVSHCSACGECVYKMDHHCIWTQTCIGFSNQKSFYLFCLYMTLGVFQFWYFTIRVLRQKTLPILTIVEPGVCILWVITAFSALFVGFMIIALFFTHTTMILTNYRTLDGMKTHRMCPMPFFSTVNDQSTLNLFDRGEIQNIKEIFGNKWYLWWVPLARQIENDIIAEKMSPHPDRLTLMKSTNLYDVEQTYCSYMNQLSDKIPMLFIGKKLKINGKIFVVQESHD